MLTSMDVVATVTHLREVMKPLVETQQTIGFVPTMGFLHDGHVQLISEAKKACQIVIVSIFVNPLQFGPTEDFSRYPRDAAGDEEKVRRAGAQVLFVPSAEEIFPHGFQTQVQVKHLAQGLCGARRPGHFDGVATIVTQLFNLIRPQMAFFGEKDFQQLHVVKRLVKDLHLPIDVMGVPIVRDKDGLALSSRNVYLPSLVREKAAMIPKALRIIQVQALEKSLSVETICQTIGEMFNSVGGLEVEYIAVVNPQTLEPVSGTKPGSAVRLLIAVRMREAGGVRLIDNCLLGVDHPLQRV